MTYTTDNKDLFTPNTHLDGSETTNRTSQSTDEPLRSTQSGNTTSPDTTSAPRNDIPPETMEPDSIICSLLCHAISDSNHHNTHTMKSSSVKRLRQHTATDPEVLTAVKSQPTFSKILQQHFIKSPRLQKPTHIIPTRNARGIYNQLHHRMYETRQPVLHQGVPSFPLSRHIFEQLSSTELYHTLLVQPHLRAILTPLYPQHTVLGFPKQSELRY